MILQHVNVSISTFFQTRRSTFKEKLVPLVEDVMQFAPSLKLRSSSGESRTLAIPIHYSHKPLIKAVKPQYEGSLTMSPYNPGDETLNMIHAALKVRKDKPGHNGFNVSENEAIDCIPE